ncbi:MAG: hypothetical protein JSV65_01475 [Armatimonadota bacterium]|nr:MAG: hypothetical protein JSV65_01475 [Armatimonadota bacterium]
MNKDTGPTASAERAIPPWAAAQFRLRQAVGDWVRAAVSRQRRIPWQGGHDEGTFTASWFGYYLLTGDEAVLDFLRWLRDGLLDWGHRHLFHGYYAEGEVHHQPENFIFFLPRLWHADPDPRVAEALNDAAHHAGNWVEGVPPWYDWDRHRFRSWRLGTREVVAEPPHDIERPDHFRIIEMALCAYRAVGDERYLDLARDFCGRWAREILDSDTLPAVQLLTMPFAEGAYSDNQVQAANGPPEQRLELHIGAGTTDVLLDLFSITREDILAAAARKILASGMAHLGEPYGHPFAAALRAYRTTTADTTLDDDIAARIHSADEEVESAMLVAAPRGPHPMGVGQRRDQVRWVISRDGERWEPDDRPSPPALVLAWDVTGDERLAAQAMRTAAERIELAAAALSDGREHGCGARSISAVASGHGRNSGIGEVTGVLYPLALGAHRRFGADDPHVIISHEGTPGLPEGCAILWRHSVPPVVRLCNAGEERTRLTTRFLPTLEEIRPDAKELVLDSGELRDVSL